MYAPTWSTEDGWLYRQNRSHLFKVPENFQVMPDESKVQWNVDTLTLPLPRKTTEERPQVLTESSALQMPGISQPDPKPASQVQDVSHPYPQPALPSAPVPVTTRSARIVRRPAYLRDFTPGGGGHSHIYAI